MRVIKGTYTNVKTNSDIWIILNRFFSGMAYSHIHNVDTETLTVYVFTV